MSNEIEKTGRGDREAGTGEGGWEKGKKERREEVGEGGSLEWQASGAARHRAERLRSIYQ